jgi:hypothetical protein
MIGGIKGDWGNQRGRESYFAGWQTTPAPFFTASPFFPRLGLQDLVDHYSWSWCRGQRPHANAARLNHREPTSPIGS